MSFSIRKMLSNITYFKKPGEEDAETPENAQNEPQNDPNAPSTSHTGELSDLINPQHTEPDSTSINSASNKGSMENFFDNKSSLSDTYLHTSNTDKARKREKKAKKLKLDIKKANKSLDEDLSHSGNSNVENTPKHILLECKSSEIFSERFKKLDFAKSLDLFEAMSDDQGSYIEDNVDIESLTDSDTDISLVNSEEEEKANIKMCRKVDDAGSEISDCILPSVTPESFGDVEIDKNEEERITMLLKYQMKLEKMECFLKKILSEFQFHIEVSKIFNCKSIVTALPGTDVSNIPKTLGDVMYIDNIDRGVSPTGSWNIIMEKEDDLTKVKLKKQLLSMKSSIDEFVNNHLKNQEQKLNQKLAYEMKARKRPKINNKKKIKYFDFPDLREAMVHLFDETMQIPNDITNLSDCDDHDISKCACHCHAQSHNDTDSGLTSKSNQSMSVTSSLGNFSLDSTTLSAYSESLQQNISYNSYQETSLLSTLLQKAAIERVTFYVQVHSIQLKCELPDQDFETKNVILFYCPFCFITETEESGLLKHILSQVHCEKIHFSYKTAYIKKCVQSGKEIQPSTVLNPMRMYRDDNKIVCFGDAVYACSLCFENLIMGESVLMAHCSEPEHVERREKLSDNLE